ncbi:hypothetical protein L227DRAFT_518868 [Lentinus tigrinus ALCF2SS1-6]|uniref:Uncharacterized protein n=1 Tax=Lentinus tigrinus ALCF2SS1-6 TaxID=1328759 RepID=A0A5C2SN62_9APHY|nr:hypothetical protein L227DRAFT_518868 [Lentinus tigrinus ALCF2SS1-6]
MDIPQSSFRFAYTILVSYLFTLLSYVLNRPINGHKLSIGRFSLFGAYDIKYKATVFSETYTFTFTAASLTWRFHLPSASNPRWCTLTCDSIFYNSTTGDISTASLETILWFFPVFFRQTAGPWANITIDGLRIRVHRSTETPYFIQRLRENLVGTFLTGEVLRADVFRTTFRFAGLSERPEEKPVGKYCTKPLTAHDDDEMSFAVLARGLHINNREGRIYTFGRIDSQIRRDWVRDRGSLALVAEECRWVHVPFPFECVAPRSGFTSLLSSLFHFPIDLVRTFNYPVSSTNLYVTRLDVTFDCFRLRDAELLKQGFSLVQEKSITSGIDWSDVFLDVLMHACKPADEPQPEDSDGRDGD